MKPMRRMLWGLLLGVALLAGCGSTQTQTADVAGGATSIVPASAVAYVSVDTAFGSEQWQQVEALVGKFPSGNELLPKLERELTGQGFTLDKLRSAVGPRVDVVALAVQKKSAAVFLTQPQDEAKLAELLRKSHDPLVTRTIDGWTAVAQTQSVLDRYESDLANGSLADDAAFQAATADLPTDALATLYANGARADDAAQKLLPTAGAPDLGTVAAAVEADASGLRVVGNAQTKGKRVDLGSLELGSRVPSGALGFVNFPALQEYVGQAGPAAGQLEQMLGVSLDQLASLLGGEGVLYVRRSVLVPEVTLALDAADPQAALQTVDKLIASVKIFGSSVPPVHEREVDGIQARQLDLGQLSVLYAVVDGRLVLTTQPSGLRALTGGGDKLVDDDRYRSAVKAAGVADGEQVVLYVDLDEASQFAGALGALGGSAASSEVTRNLGPLDTLVVAAKSDGGRIDFRLYLGVK
jgi:hypothetical protein